MPEFKHPRTMSFSYFLVGLTTGLFSALMPTTSFLTYLFVLAAIVAAFLSIHLRR